MGYLHISNLYRDTTILMFREVFALEKIHGTSAHVGWKDGSLHFFSGGEKHERFVSLFDQDALALRFTEMGHAGVTVYGEAYGGKQQGQSHRYGTELKFVAFDVKVGDSWLEVPKAEALTKSLGLEFVYYVRVSTDLATLDAERDAPSAQAKRNGIVEDKNREGVVLRPPFEVTLNNGERVIAKHKRDDERETDKPRKVVDVSQLEVLSQADAIATEFVTNTRLEHVLDKLRVDGADVGIERMREVISAMISDVVREGEGEFVDSKPARAAISRRAAELFKQKLKSAIAGGATA